MGSNLNVAVMRGFKNAMNAGRIFVFAMKDGGFLYTDKGTFCAGKRSWECWFEPVSRCVPGPTSDVYHASGQGKGAKCASKSCGPYAVNEMIPPSSSAFYNRTNSSHYTDVYSAYPIQFKDLLACSGVKPSHYFYWWTAQALAYVMRLTQRTRTELDKLRATKLRMVSHGKQVHATDVPTGAVGIYVRHGKKAVEAGVYPWATYFRSMEHMVMNASSIPVLAPHLSTAKAPVKFATGQDFSSRVMVLGTEDPQVISSATASPWTTIYTDYPRSNQDVWMQHGRVSVISDVLNAFLNLELALEADAWVLTLSSNWCRLIDTLRMTVAGKADAILVDLSAPEVICNPMPPNSNSFERIWVQLAPPCYRDARGGAGRSDPKKQPAPQRSVPHKQSSPYR